MNDSPDISGPSLPDKAENVLMQTIQASQTQENVPIDGEPQQKFPARRSMSTRENKAENVVGNNKELEIAQEIIASDDYQVQFQQSFEMNERIFSTVKQAPNSQEQSSILDRCKHASVIDNTVQKKNRENMTIDLKKIKIPLGLSNIFISIYLSDNYYNIRNIFIKNEN